MMNYYSILELPYFADSEDVKKAHRRLSKKYHPDLNPGNTIAEEKFKQIQHAYEQLNNPDRKANYDELLRLNLYRSQQSQSTGTTGTTQQTNQQYTSQQQTRQQQYYYKEETEEQYRKRPKFDMEDDLPPDTKKDILLKLSIIGLFMLIIGLGAIFGKREPSLPTSFNNNTQGNYQPSEDPVISELDISPQSSKEAVRNKMGKPEEVFKAEDGMEIWSYSQYLLFFQDGKFVTALKIKKAPADSAE